MNSMLIRQFRSLIPLFIKIYLPTLLLLLITVVLSIFTHIPISEFMRDPTDIMNIQPFVGFISNIGILFWCATAALCFFSAALLKKVKNHFYFFFYAGLITTLLLFDDLLRLHERILPTYFYLNEKIIYLTYFLAIAVFLIKFRKEILKSDFLLLFFSFVFFGVSIGLDMVLEKTTGWGMLYEDGAKLFGIISWFAYFTRIGFQALRDTVNKINHK